MRNLTQRQLPQKGRAADAAVTNEGEPAGPTRMVTLRAILLALLIMPINAWWIVRMEVTRYAGHPTTISLFFNVVFWLTLLLCANGLLRKIAPRKAFAPGELLTVYIMLALASAVAGHDMIEVLTPMLAHAFQYARPENGWTNDILPYLPSWLTVSQKPALDEFYNGTGTLYSAQNIGAWIRPVLCWTGFLTLLGWMMLCINTLLRKQWTEAEKLAYPLVSLPLEMASPKAALFKTPLFWLGFGIAATLEVWNGLAFLYPQIPMLPLKNDGAAAHNVATYFSARPWNAIGWTPLAVYPFGVALGMLLPVDLLFSAWFFAWVSRGERVAGASLGLEAIPNFPFVDEQAFGAFLGLAIFSLWTSRAKLLAIWYGITERGVDLDDAGEPLPYRVAALGLVGGGLLLFVFCRLCGMTSWVILAFFAVYFLLAVAITRMRAELGPPAHDLHHGGPDQILPMITPNGQLARSDLAMFSLFYGFNRAYRAHPMPIQLEGFKIGEQVNIDNGRSNARPYTALLFAMLLAMCVGSLCGFWANLDQGYRFGAAARIAPPNVMLIFGGEPWNRMKGWIATPPLAPQQAQTRTAILVGFGLTLLLNAMRLRIPGFPLHPVGYAISGSWSMSLLWLPLFIAWGTKLLLLRYGGLKAYRQSLPLFFGVILGECIVGSLWTLIGIWIDAPTYAFWP